MTDNYIIKALECCKAYNCKECSYRGKCNEIKHDALDLINRQKAENIDLKGKIVAKNIVIETQKAEIDNLNKDLSDTIALNYEERKVLKAEIEKLQGELETTRAYLHDNGLEWDLLSYSKRNGG
jgi:protein-arginine kinase activator protein McsA